MSIVKPNQWPRDVVLLFASVCLVGGIAFACYGATWPLPSEADLTEVRAPLRSYSYRSGKSGLTVVLTLQDGSKVWTNALTRWQADELLSAPVEIQTWIWPQADYVPIDGAVKSFGLSINGREIRTNQLALSRDFIIVRVLFPFLGLMVALAGVAVYRSSQGKSPVS
jgi:hypothetical protein